MSYSQSFTKFMFRSLNTCEVTRKTDRTVVLIHIFLVVSTFNNGNSSNLYIYIQ